MKAEYKVFFWLGFWLFLWTFLPFVAAPLMLIMVIRHFKQVRKQRQLNEYAQKLHNFDKQWAEMEGFSAEYDEADWWKTKMN